MNFITLIDQAENEILLNLGSISSCSFARDKKQTATIATVFMKSGEKHAFAGAEAAKLDDKIKAL